MTSSGKKLAWKVEYKEGVLKDVARFDRTVQRRLKKFIEGLAASDNPRLKGKAKQGGEGLWLYRVGDCRIEAEIRDKAITIIVFLIGHRGKVYR